MRSETEIRRELKRVRHLLKEMRDAGQQDETDLLYGAQQTLCWILKDGRSPSDVEQLIHKLAETI
jgi:hypothetical protein